MTISNDAVILRKKGLTCKEIAEQLGSSPSYIQQVVYKHGLSFKVISSSPFGKRYDWKEVQQYYDAGHDRKACLLKFGILPGTWDAAGKSGRVVLRPKLPREDVFKIRKIRSGKMLKHHLKKLGLLKNKCKICGISDWMGKPITLQIDHENGDHADNREENLRELCPNCHSQTPTFCSKNKSTRIKNFEVEVKRLSQAGWSNLKLAAYFKCSPATIAHIVNGWSRYRYG